MSTHPYLRAYMAGITLPTMFLLVIMTLFTVARYVYNIPVPIERIIVFPMAVVPNLWGVWNMLYLRLSSGRHWSLGIHGAILPFVLAPLGFFVAQQLRIVSVLGPVAVAVFPIGVIFYYLAWKLLVGFLNE